MPLYFITSSKNKFNEVKQIIPEVEQLDIDLPEIQEIDPKKIIEAKLQEAFNHHSGEFIVDDTSLSFDALNGLPGPFIKWFINILGTEGTVILTQPFNKTHATARTIIGYAKNKDEIHFFEGSISGTVVKPRGDKGFGWDSIFQPEGFKQTFAEMVPEEKAKISMRKIAAEKLHYYLRNNP